MAQQTPTDKSSGFTTGADTGNQSVVSNNTASNLFMPQELEEVDPPVVERLGGADTEAAAGMAILEAIMAGLVCIFGAMFLFLIMPIFARLLFTGSTTRF